jgi:Protein of unknown function (DUF2934)
MRKPRTTSRRVKKADAAAFTPDIAAESATRDVAEESAAIYPDTFNTPPTPEEIAAEAYRIYCERGQEQGRDIEHWFEAERRLSERRMRGRAQTGGNR